MTRLSGHVDKMTTNQISKCHPSIYHVLFFQHQELRHGKLLEHGEGAGQDRG